MILRNEDSSGKDERYCEWFTCKKCQNSIEEGANFCSECGVKITWRIEAPKPPKVPKPPKRFAKKLDAFRLGVYTEELLRKVTR